MGAKSAALAAPLEHVWGFARRFVAGADVFSRQSDGTTIAAQYGREGVTLRPANMDRVNGWAAILSGLGDPAAGVKPTLFIHRRCTTSSKPSPVFNTIPTVPKMSSRWIRTRMASVATMPPTRSGIWSPTARRGSSWPNFGGCDGF